MFRIALTVVVALGLAFGQGQQRGVARPPTPALAAAAGSYYALIVGIDNYATLTKLKTAVNDARSMEAALRDGYGFQKPDLLTDREATRAGILDAMERYRGVLRETDSLLIYYAGHGQMDREANRAYWLPVDAGRTQSSWISADDIAAAVRAMPSRHVLVISDSCYSGDLTGTRAPNLVSNPADHSAYLQKMMGAKSRTFIASGGDEPVSDGGSNGHSVFTGAVLRGLRALEGNAFSAENLFQWYLREQVGGGSSQTPHFDYMRASGHVDGDFVFVSGVATEAKAGPVSVPDPGPRAAADAALQVEIAFWNGINKNDAESLQMYLDQYPRGQFVAPARRDLALLAAAAPPTSNPAPSAPTLRAGQTKLNQKDGLRYIWIPPGPFQMGCSPGDNECDDDEKPAHAVTISKGFYMGQTSVTVAAWKRYKAAGGPALSTADSLGRKLNEAAGNDSVPAVAMTWDEAKNYCEWANGRLPTEGEWELAARAGTTASRYGNIDDIASYGDNSGQKRIDSTAIWNTDQANYAKRLFDTGNSPKPVGQKPPNAYGLYDILGNVWNWTADWYDEKYYQRGESQDPTGPPGGKERALRGGSWDGFPQVVRVSYRYRFEPELRYNNIGVRCVGE